MNRSTTDVIRHLVDEVAADGDQGSTVQRIHVFLDTIQKQQGGEFEADDQIRNFILSTLARHPDILLRHGTDKDLTTIEREDDGGGGFPMLMDRYGSRLRFVAKEDVINSTLYGCRELNPSQRVVLILISRARGKGVEFPDLCKALNTQTSNIFYQCKGLIELGLIIKTRGDTGRGPNCSHVVAVRFAHLSPLLQAGVSISHTGQGATSSLVENEEIETTTKTTTTTTESGDHAEVKKEWAGVQLEEMSMTAIENLAPDDAASESSSSESEDDGDGEDRQSSTNETDEQQIARPSNKHVLPTSGQGRTDLIHLEGLLAFPEIKERAAIRALSRDKTQIRIRILKLVTESRNMTTVARGLVIRLGARKYTTLERRSIRSVIRPMITEGLLEFVPIRYSTDHGDVTIKGIRATEEGIAQYRELMLSTHTKLTRELSEMYTRHLRSSQSAIEVEVPLERQMIELIARSGSEGTTIDALNTAFSGSTERKRDLDKVLNIAEKEGIDQYKDLLLSTAFEQSGRVRSKRFWTQSWRPVLTASGAHQEEHVDVSKLTTPVVMPMEIIDPSLIGEGLNSNNNGRRKRRSSKSIAVMARSGKRLGRPPKASKASLEKQRKKRIAEGSPVVTDEENETRVESEKDDEQNDVPSAIDHTTRKRQRTNVPDDEESEHMHTHHDSPSPPLVNDDQANEIVTQRVKGAAMDAGEKPVRTNLTIELKRETLLKYIASVEVVEASKIERGYARYIVEKVEPPQMRTACDMDRKVRNRILARLLKEGKIETRRTIGPKPKTTKGKARTVTLYFLKGTDLSKVTEHGRRVMNGEFEERGVEDRSWMQQQSLAMTDVDLPTGSAYSGRVMLFMRAGSVGELLDDPRYRQEMVAIDQIRSSYTGRLLGRAARMRFVHQLSLSLLLEHAEHAFIDQSERIVDLRWWTSEARLSQYLYIAFPSQEEDLLAASQDQTQLSQQMKFLNDSLRNALQLDQDETGLVENFSTIMQDLATLGLMEPVEIQDGRYVATDWSVNSLLYRFKSRVKVLGWDADDSLAQNGETLHFVDGGQVSRFWSSLIRTATGERRTQMVDLPESEKVHFDDTFVEMLRQPASWFSTYRMIRVQRNFILRCIHLGALNDDTLQNQSLLARISYAGVVPIGILERFFMRHFKIPRAPKVVHQHGSLGNGSSLLRTVQHSRAARPAVDLPMTKRRYKRIVREAKRAKAELQVKFDELVNAFFDDNEVSEDERAILRSGLARARDAFSKGYHYMRQEQVQPLLSSLQRLLSSGKADSYNSFVRQTTAPRSRGMIKQKGRKPTSRRRRGDDADGEREEEREEEDRSNVSNGKRARRTRKSALEWTPELDEVLRDCGVILRARDKLRNAGLTPRKNWSALKQIFPLSNGATLHNRFLKLQSAVGEEAYLAQLEVEWTKLWSSHRGTDVLSDDDPLSATNFDLKEHLRFLREQINKNEVLATLRRGTGEPLPIKVEDIVQTYDFEFPTQTSVTVDPTTTLTNRRIVSDAFNELRGDLLLRTALSERMFDGFSHSYHLFPFEQTMSLAETRARNLVKMMVGTMDSRYDFNAASALYNENATDEEISKATSALTKAHIIKTVPKEDRAVPNRSVEYTGDWQSFISDVNFETLPIWQAVMPIADSKQQQNGQSLTIFQTATDEQTAAAILLIDKAHAKVDLDVRPIEGFARNRLFNAKKLSDSELEIPVCVSSSSDHPFGRLASRLDALLEGEDASTEESVLAWCDGKESSKDEIQTDWTRRFDELLASDSFSCNRESAIRLRAALCQAGAQGITRDEMKEMTKNETDTLTDLVGAVDLALSTRPPLAFSAGADQARLVSSAYVVEWTIRMPSCGRRLIPHPWLDIYGETIPRIWHDSMALILYAIYAHPGLTVERLVDHLRAGALTRNDVYHLLACARQAGVVEQCLSDDPSTVGSQAFWQAFDDTDVALFLRLDK